VDAILYTRMGGRPDRTTSPLRIAVPLVSAVMQAVSSPRLAIALAQTGGLSFAHQNQPIDEQAAMVGAVKRHKAGFRHSDINTKPTATLAQVSRLLKAAERDIAVVTDDGSPTGAFASSQDQLRVETAPPGVELRPVPLDGRIATSVVGRYCTV
jgi:IMP dehydrogenase/GMP reductase